MQVSLLEISDHRRREGKRFDLSTVLHAIVAMVAGALISSPAASQSSSLASA